MLKDPTAAPKEDPMRAWISGLFHIAGLVAFTFFGAWLYLGVATHIKPTTEPTPPALDAVTIRIRAGSVNVRRGPGQDFEVVGKIPTGATLWECRAEENWVQVQSDSIDGWVARRFTAPTAIEPAFRPGPPCARTVIQRVEQPTFTERLKAGIVKSGILTGRQSVFQTMRPLALFFIGMAFFIVGLAALVMAYGIDSRPRGFTVPNGRRQSYLPDGFHLCRWACLYGIALVVVLSWLYAPPDAQLVEPSFMRVDGDDESKESVDLYFIQNYAQIPPLFPLGPTTDELILRSKDGKRTWTLKPEYEAEVRATIDDSQLFPLQRYSQGWFAIVAILLLWLFAVYFGQLRRDGIDFNRALHANTFSAYLDFIACKGHRWGTRRTSPYAWWANARIRWLLKNFVTFFEHVTHRPVSPPLRSWFINLTRSLSARRATYVHVEFKGKIDGADWRQSKQTERADLEALMQGVGVGQYERLEAQREQVLEELGFRNVYEIRNVLQRRTAGTLHEAIVKTLTSIFDLIFSAPLLKFTTAPTNAQHKLTISYTVKRTPELFYRTKQKYWPMDERDWFVGARFDWKIDATHGSLLAGESTFTSKPAHELPAHKLPSGDLFIGLAINAFVALGRTALTHIGFDGSAEQWSKRSEEGTKASESISAIQELIGDLTRSNQERLFAEHQQQIEDFRSWPHAHFEDVAERLTSELSS